MCFILCPCTDTFLSNELYSTSASCMVIVVTFLTYWNQYLYILYLFALHSCCSTLKRVALSAHRVWGWGWTVRCPATMQIWRQRRRTFWGCWSEKRLLKRSITKQPDHYQRKHSHLPHTKTWSGQSNIHFFPWINCLPSKSFSLG